jgi:3-phenylpropionate/trans-cinnamate dioxygenase ferredoxin reductase subunit
MSSVERIVIVGAGLAGARAAEGLRTAGFDGAVTLVGEEADPPYLRPPLSKEYLRGEEPRDKVLVHDEAFYAEHDFDFRPSTIVRAIAPAARAVVTDGGRVEFDRLLIATGARPRGLAVPGANLRGVLALRTLADGDRLRALAAEAERIVVVGAGWIGSEVAASLRMLGRRVVLVGRDPLPLRKVLGPEVASVYRDLHLAHGVELRLGTDVRRIVGRDRVEGVETTAGENIVADLVVVGVGAEPRTELATAAGIAVGGGILVSATLETSIPGIFAAGDVAAAWHPFYQQVVRSEHWANAKFQGTAAAAALLGDGTPYDRIPYFYSDQYELGMEYTGRASTSDRLVVRGRLDDREFVAFWLADDGRVNAGMNANVWDVAKPIERLIRSRAVVPPASLADPSVSIDDLATAGNLA